MLLQTAFPIVFGLSVVAPVGVIEDGTFNVWILCTTAVLFVSMIASYAVARGTHHGGVAS